MRRDRMQEEQECEKRERGREKEEGVNQDWWEMRGEQQSHAYFGVWEHFLLLTFTKLIVGYFLAGDLALYGYS